MKKMIAKFEKRILVIAMKLCVNRLERIGPTAFEDWYQTN